MKTGITIVAGLLVGVLVAVGILAAFVFVGPEPVGLRAKPSPTIAAIASVAPSASPIVACASAAPGSSVAPAGSAAPIGSVGPSGPAPSSPIDSAAPSSTAAPSATVAPSAPATSAAPGSSVACIPGASPSPAPSLGSGDAATFHIGQPAPALEVTQVGGGTIDLANLRGQPVWLNFMQTTCPECVDEFPLMNGFATRYASTGLVVMAIDIREDEALVAAFADRLNAQFPLELDIDGKAQQAWGTYALPIHFWIDKDGIVRAGALGGAGADALAAGLQKILPGVTVTP